MALHPSSADLLTTLDHLRASQPDVYRAMAWRHGVFGDAETSCLVMAIEIDGGNCFGPFLRTTGVSYAQVLHNPAAALGLSLSQPQPGPSAVEAAVVDEVLQAQRRERSSRDARARQALMRSAGPLPAPTEIDNLTSSPPLTAPRLAQLLYGPTSALARSLQELAVRAALRQWLARQGSAQRLVPTAQPDDEALPTWTLQDAANPVMICLLRTVVEVACYRLSAPESLDSPVPF
jgi:hypothetical protein